MDKKQFKQRHKELKKKKFINKTCKHVSGVPGWNEDDFAYLFIDTENNGLVIINGLGEVFLPFDRITEVKTFSEKEIEEYQKNRIGSGLVAGAIAGPLAGILVGSNKKTKRKTTYNIFFGVGYMDKEGNPQELLFKPTYNDATYLYFSKLEKGLKPYIQAPDNTSDYIEL